MKQGANDIATDSVAVGSDYPPWITPELVSETMRVWNWDAVEQRSRQDAVDVLLHFSQLLDVAGLDHVQEIQT